MSSRPILLAAVALSALCLASPALAAVVTDFSSGLAGWTVTGDNAATWSATSGNPGACLFVNDLATGDNNYAVAPARYLGDWSAMGAGDSLSTDLWLQLLSGTPVQEPWLFRIEGPGGAAHAVTNVLPPYLAWTRYSVSLSPADWVLESGTWSALLANVTSLLVEGEYVSGDEDCRIDNVVLTRDPTRVFNPCVVETFNAPGLGAWSFSSTGGTSNPGDGGNTLGFCRVVDGAGTSYAYAPPAFLGDWSPLDGSGRVQLDVRMIAQSGAHTVTEMVRLSGPGGTAVASIAIGDLPPAPRLWKRFVFPIRESAWTVTSGTWAGLVADVTEMRIGVEYFNGTDNVGIDNVARLSASCADPDTRVNVYPVGPYVCDVTAFSRLQSVALNPATGHLEGLVDSTASGGGGLWSVTGPAAGTLLQAYTNPTGLLHDAAGNAYVSEDASGIVYRRTPAGVSSAWVTGFHAGDDDPAGMCFAPEGFAGPNVSPGDVLVTDWGFSGPDEIWSFSTAAAENEKLVVPDPGEVDVMDLAAGPAGRVWFADALDPDSLFSFGPTGVVTGIRLASPVPDMVSIAWDPVPGTGWLYVLSRSGGALHRVNPLTGAVQKVADGFVYPEMLGLEIDPPTRRLWVTDEGAGRVYQFCLPYAFSDAPAAVTDGERLRLAVGPNPARGPARVRFTLAAPADVQSDVFDLQGRRVCALAVGRRAPGDHEVVWDGRTTEGAGAPAGVYLVRLRAGDAVAGARFVRAR